MKEEVKILIVEDDMFYVDDLKRGLLYYTSSMYPDFHFSVKSSTNAEDFLEKLEKDMDVVVMEYYLENEFGEVLFPGIYLVRAVDLYCDECKVIVMAGKEDVEIETKLKKRGVFDFIVKGEDTFLKLILDVDKIVKAKQSNTLV